MILKRLGSLRKNWRLVTASIALLSLVAGFSLPAPSVQAAATYSCGSYSSGAYSENATCNASDGSTVGAPNTGFAKLMEPANLAAIIGSLALLIAGIVIMVKSRRKKYGPSRN